MKKSDINQAPSYFDTYINKVEDIELIEALKQSIAELNNLDMAAFEKLGNKVYAEGKWTTKDIFPSPSVIIVTKNMGYGPA